MKTTENIIVLDEMPYNGFNNLYQAMCVQQDLTVNCDTLFYKAEELDLEVV